MKIPQKQKSNEEKFQDMREDILSILKRVEALEKQAKEQDKEPEIKLATWYSTQEGDRIFMKCDKYSDIFKVYDREGGMIWQLYGKRSITSHYYLLKELKC